MSSPENTPQKKKHYISKFKKEKLASFQKNNPSLARNKAIQIAYIWMNKDILNIYLIKENNIHHQPYIMPIMKAFDAGFPNIIVPFENIGAEFLVKSTIPVECKNESKLLSSIQYPQYCSTQVSL